MTTTISTATIASWNVVCCEQLGYIKSPSYPVFDVVSSVACSSQWSSRSINTTTKDCGTQASTPKYSNFTLEPCLPSVFWHCWLGHLTRKNPPVPDMTYNAFGRTLNLALSINSWQENHRHWHECHDDMCCCSCCYCYDRYYSPVVEVQDLRWGNGTFSFGPPLPGYVHFPSIVTIRGGERRSLASHYTSTTTTNYYYSLSIKKQHCMWQSSHIFPYASWKILGSFSPEKLRSTYMRVWEFAISRHHGSQPCELYRQQLAGIWAGTCLCHLIHPQPSWQSYRPTPRQGSSGGMVPCVRGYRVLIINHRLSQCHPSLLSQQHPALFFCAA